MATVYVPSACPPLAAVSKSRPREYRRMKECVPGYEPRGVQSRSYSMPIHLPNVTVVQPDCEQRSADVYTQIQPETRDRTRRAA